MRLSEREQEDMKRNLVPAYTDHELAQIALGYVNEKQDVKFELDAPVGSHWQIRLPPTRQWCHVSFYAKKPNHTSPKLIFVELCNVMKAQYSLSMFSIMDPDTADVKDGCSFCPPDGKHPHPPEEIYVAGCHSGFFWRAPTEPTPRRDRDWWRKHCGLH
ncbi:hypothetical protein M5689_020009 [Euphorbia peplus]|nr:hypothetical protein M5689_020009 [Euphorbia peplus]